MNVGWKIDPPGLEPVPNLVVRYQRSGRHLPAVVRAAGLLEILAKSGLLAQDTFGLVLDRVMLSVYSHDHRIHPAFDPVDADSGLRRGTMRQTRAAIHWTSPATVGTTPQSPSICGTPVFRSGDGQLLAGRKWAGFFSWLSVGKEVHSGSCLLEMQPPKRNAASNDVEANNHV